MTFSRVTTYAIGLGAVLVLVGAGVTYFRVPATNDVTPVSVTGTTSRESIASSTLGDTSISTEKPMRTVASSTVVSAATSTSVVAGKKSSQITWGAYVGDGADDASAFEALVGKKMGAQMVFVQWGSDTFPMEYKERLGGTGKTMVLFWDTDDNDPSLMGKQAHSFDDVLSGKDDAYFKQFAADAAAYGSLVILIPYSEFNGDWYPWGGMVGNNSPEKFIAAYRYVRGFFKDASNVKFAWVPNADSVPDVPKNAFEHF